MKNKSRVTSKPIYVDYPAWWAFWKSPKIVYERKWTPEEIKTKQKIVAEQFKRMGLK
jgi:hypothetical protein